MKTSTQVIEYSNGGVWIFVFRRLLMAQHSKTPILALDFGTRWALMTDYLGTMQSSTCHPLSLRALQKIQSECEDVLGKE
jgi:hypothetical protein